MTSGVLTRDVQITVTCDCTPDTTEHLPVEHTCGWHGRVDASIDPEDRLNGFDAVWTCPWCGCEHVEREGTW